MANETTVGHHIGKHGGSGYGVPLGVVKDIETSIQNGQTLDAIDSLIARQIIQQLSNEDDAPASLIKVAMDYLKERGYAPADMASRSRAKGKKPEEASLDDMVDWAALPPIHELNTPLDKMG